MTTEDQRPETNDHPAGIPAHVVRAWPGLVARGMIRVATPAEIYPRYSTHWTDAKRAACSRRMRAWWAERRVSGNKQARGARPGNLAAAREWIATGPHPYGTLKGFCADRGLRYSTIVQVLTRLGYTVRKNHRKTAA